MSAYLAAVQFLLFTPSFMRRDFTPEEMGRGVAYYPIVGLLLGGLLAAGDALLGFVFPLAVRSALILALWVALTGALHIDGFLDACDGLLGGWTPERRMEIMRDERVGAYALAGGILLFLILFSALGAINEGRWAALLLAPVLGRWGVSTAVVLFPYARAAGLGRDIKDHAGRGQLLIATLSMLVVVTAAAVMLHSVLPVAATLVAGVVFWLATRFIIGRIPGMTGDTYGAINMLIEAGVLLTFAAMH